MKSLNLTYFIAFMCFSPLSFAHQATVISNQTAIPSDAKEAIATVERFNAGIASGNIDSAKRELDDNVLILESGGAEHSAQEYLNGHAKADVDFMKGTVVTVKNRRAQVNGDMTWVGTESEMRYQKDGKEITLLSTETMILKRNKNAWKIVHIHWSSHTKK